MNNDNITSINNTIINRKIIAIYPFNSVFFMLLAVKLFGIFPKHNGYGFISEFFALN